MNDHTPGPWHYDDETATIDNDMGVAVAGVNVELDNYEANAAVLAAAPDLLTALASIDELLSHPGNTQTATIAWVRRVANEAITKAQRN